MSNFDILDAGRESMLKMIHFLLYQKLARVPLKNHFQSTLPSGV